MTSTLPPSPAESPRPEASATTPLPPPEVLRPQLVPPQAPSPVQAPAVPARAWRSPQRLATALQWSLLVGAVVAALDAAATVADYRLVGRLTSSPTSVTAADLDASDQRQLVLSIVLFVVWMGVFGLLIAWTRRLYRNLAPLGARGLRFSEGWAVGAWFVPLLNLVRPKQILNDIWRASEPGTGSDGWQHNRVSPLLHWWWAAVLGGWLLFRPTTVETTDPEGIQEVLVGEALAAILLLTTATLGLIVVKRLTDRQVGHAGLGAAPLPTEAGRAAPPAEVRHRASRLPSWLAPVVGVATFALAVTIFEVSSHSAGGSARAERTNDGSITSRGSVLAMDLRVGDCFDDPDGLASAAPGETVDVVGVEVLPCDAPHDNEVFAIVDHPAGSDAAFPGEEALGKHAVERCVDQFEGWVGLPYEESILDVIVIAPQADGWRLGDRSILCAAHRLDLQKLDSSVRNAAI